MTLTDILKKRRSVRKFEARPVPRDVVEGVLRLALTAPSSKNVRSTRFVVIEAPDTLQQIAQMRDFGSSLLATAPCAIVVAGDDSDTDLWVDNAAISATILQLAAQDAGLGSCWVHVNGRPQLRDQPNGPTAEDHLRKILPLPAQWRPLCVVALGYPLEVPRPHHERDDEDKIIWL